MFKYFTFKGILCSLKKFIVPAIVGVIVFALLGAGFGKGTISSSGSSFSSTRPPQALMTSATVTALGIKCRAIRLAGVV